ncbi:hypothetical protein PTQ27_09055 [Mannheimia sp. AT1]|uniref:Pyruvate kinase n=1 Tax=Mannheimia cairinae TaxID=3025936 RepID=A0ABT5MSX5_9PAST|nr:hypothetical protein [Mannheimia cairinae]MDD0824604.1 hypothetical protein [Mannheimia cairinae]MDD0826467.1 hypothetical protein [Mannheimia cairinae]
MKPFNLEEALSGKLVNFKGYKCYIYARRNSKNTYIVESTSDYSVWNPVYLEELEEYTMWGEPRPTVTLTLPCPLKEPQYEMWYMDITYRQVIKYVYNENLSQETFDLCIYFGSKEDAQAWLDAMRDNRR